MCTVVWLTIGETVSSEIASSDQVDSSAVEVGSSDADPEDPELRSCSSQQRAGGVFLFDWELGERFLRPDRQHIGVNDFFFPEDSLSCACEDAIYPSFESQGALPRPWWAMFLVNIRNRKLMNSELNNAATSIFRRECPELDADAIRAAVPADPTTLLVEAFKGGLLEAGVVRRLYTEELFLEGLEDWVNNGFTPVGGVDLQAMNRFTAKSTEEPLRAILGISAAALWLAAAGSLNGVGRPGANVAAYSEALALAHFEVRDRALTHSMNPGYTPKGLAFFSSTAANVDFEDWTRIFDFQNTYRIIGLAELALPYLASTLMDRTIRAAFSEPLLTTEELVKRIESAGFEVEPVVEENDTRAAGKGDNKSRSLLSWLTGWQSSSSLTDKAAAPPIMARAPRQAGLLKASVVASDHAESSVLAAGDRTRHLLSEDAKRPTGSDLPGNVPVDDVVTIVGAPGTGLINAFKQSISQALDIRPEKVEVGSAVLVGADLTVFVVVKTPCNLCKDAGLSGRTANLTSTCEYHGVAEVEPGVLMPWHITDLETARSCMDCDCVE